MPGVSKRSSVTRWHLLLSRHPNDREDAREHNLKVLDRWSKRHRADLPDTSPSYADCKRRRADTSEQLKSSPPFGITRLPPSTDVATLPITLPSRQGYRSILARQLYRSTFSSGFWPLTLPIRVLSAWHAKWPALRERE